MSVLVEAITVIFRNDTAEALIQGGVETIRRNPPNATFRTDGKISAVGFMTPNDVGEFVQTLEQAGFVFVENENSKDIAVCDQQRGFTAHNEWLGTDTDERGVRYCWLLGHEPGDMITQENWTYDSSLYTTGNFTANDEPADHLKHLRTEGNMEVYWDEKREQEVYVGRTASDAEDIHTERKKSLLFATAVKVAYDGLLADGWLSIKTNMYADDFPHLIMRYRNQLAVIFIDVDWDQEPISELDQRKEKQMIDIAGQLTGTPIVVGIEISGDTKQPLKTISDVEGCSEIEFSLSRPYLAHELLENREWLPQNHDLEAEVELSNWEVHDFGIQVARQALQHDGHQIQHYDSGFSALIQIEAVIDSELTFILCRTVRYPKMTANFEPELVQKAAEHAARNNAVLKTASVRLVNSDDALDPGSNFALPLFRGKEVSAGFDGLETPMLTSDA
jgi:hypothetical protein